MFSCEIRFLQPVQCAVLFLAGRMSWRRNRKGTRIIGPDLLLLLLLAFPGGQRDGFVSMSDGWVFDVVSGSSHDIARPGLCSLLFWQGAFMLTFGKGWQSASSTGVHDQATAACFFEPDSGASFLGLLFLLHLSPVARLRLRYPWHRRPCPSRTVQLVSFSQHRNSGVHLAMFRQQCPTQPRSPKPAMQCPTQRLPRPKLHLQRLIPGLPRRRLKG